MKTENIRKVRTASLLLVSLVMMAYGISRGEMQVVLDKAVRICMECIGIG